MDTHEFNEFEISSSILFIYQIISTNEEFYQKLFFENDEDTKKVQKEERLNKLFNKLFGISYDYFSYALTHDNEGGKKINLLFSEFIRSLNEKIKFKIITGIKKNNKYKKMFDGLLFALQEILMEDDTLTDQMIHEMTINLHDDSIPFPIRGGNPSSTPIELQYGNNIIIICPDYNITRLLQVTTYLCKRAYPGYENDMRNIFNLIKCYYSSALYDTENFYEKDFVDEMDSYSRKLIRIVKEDKNN